MKITIDTKTGEVKAGGKQFKELADNYYETLKSKMK